MCTLDLFSRQDGTLPPQDHVVLKAMYFQGVQHFSPTDILKSILCIQSVAAISTMHVFATFKIKNTSRLFFSLCPN